MREEPRWLTIPLVKALHSESIERFGGSEGVRDEGLLASALDRPRNLYAYGEDPSLFDLAAALCVALVKNHAFVDGNKRVSLLGAVIFLDLNGRVFRPNKGDPTAMMTAVASDRTGEAALAAWFEEFSRPKE